MENSRKKPQTVGIIKTNSNRPDSIYTKPHNQVSQNQQKTESEPISLREVLRTIVTNRMIITGIGKKEWKIGPVIVNFRIM